MELSEENGVCCQCGGIYGELEGQNLSGVSGWTYSIGGIGQWGCPLTSTPLQGSDDLALLVMKQDKR